MTLTGTLLLLVALGSASVGAQAPAAVTPGSPTQAPLGVERRVPVAAHSIARGVMVSPADYQISAVIVRAALRNAVAAESGWVTRRPVAAGEALIEPAVGPPALVTAGQAVNFVAEAGSVRLSIRGTAATAGALGDRVWVRMDSGRRLRGLVTAPATVSADTTSLR
jgi:flagella basal body P-ring formation protein FlgA